MLLYPDQASVLPPTLYHPSRIIVILSTFHTRTHVRRFQGPVALHLVSPLRNQGPSIAPCSKPRNHHQGWHRVSRSPQPPNQRCQNPETFSSLWGSQDAGSWLRGPPRLIPKHSYIKEKEGGGRRREDGRSSSLNSHSSPRPCCGSVSPAQPAPPNSHLTHTDALRTTAHAHPLTLFTSAAGNPNPPPR